jgi:hypothetical protein
MPSCDKLQLFLRESRRVGRDGFIRWDRALYGLSSPWTPGQTVLIHAEHDLAEIWMGDRRVAVHPRATRPGARLRHPCQWVGVDTGGARPRKEPLTFQIASIEVQCRSLEAYDQLIAAGVR